MYCSCVLAAQTTWLCDRLANHSYTIVVVVVVVAIIDVLCERALTHNCYKFNLQTFNVRCGSRSCVAFWKAPPPFDKSRGVSKKQLRLQTPLVIDCCFETPPLMVCQMGGGAFQSATSDWVEGGRQIFFVFAPLLCYVSQILHAIPSRTPWIHTLTSMFKWN